MAEPEGTSSQSPLPDQSNTTGTAGQEPETTAVGDEDETATANEPSLPTMIRELDLGRYSHETLVAEAREIYKGLTMVEAKCIQVLKAHVPATGIPLDIIRFLEKIPHSKLALLQDGDMRPHLTVCTWFATAQKRAAESHAKASALLLETSEGSSTISHHPPTAREGSPATVRPLAMGPPAPSVQAYLSAFQVALELRAKALGWPEYEALAALTLTEIGHEGRQMAIDRKDHLDIADELVDKLVRDLDTAAEKKAAKETEDVATEQHSDQDSTDKKPACTKSPNTTTPGKDTRDLQDRRWYRKTGKQVWFLSAGQWISSLSTEQYQAVIALHSCLLKEHHDFLLATHHPSGPPALQSLITKHAMLARLWKLAIHALLEPLRVRLPESREVMGVFIHEAYSVLSSLQETVPQFTEVFAECKGDMCRYGMVTLSDSPADQQRWQDMAREQYALALDHRAALGRLYHNVGLLAQPCSFEPDTSFNARVSQFFYYTKALVVERPFSRARGTLLLLINDIAAKREACRLNDAKSIDRDNFLTAVSHLCLASLEPNLLQAHGHRANKGYHLEVVCAALGEIRRYTYAIDPPETLGIQPSPQLGLLLCQLLLGIPPAEGRRSPMMAAWAPDLAMADGRAQIAPGFSTARDTNEASIKMVDTMIPHLLKNADTRDLRVWGFIYVILVFMRALKTRPALQMWLGPAFHAELLAPLVNMLLREDKALGRYALRRAAKSEFLTWCSELNPKEKEGGYALTTEDNLKRYTCAQERRKAEGGTSSAVAEEAVAAAGGGVARWETTSTAQLAMVTLDGALARRGAQRGQDTKAPIPERVYANVLPEHDLLRGHFFAREACATPPPDGTAALGASPDEARLRDPPLFPEKWFDRSKYDHEDRLVRLDRVQDADSWDDRVVQIVCLAVQLVGPFFTWQTDEKGDGWFSVPGGRSVPQLDPSMKMPRVLARDGGARVIFVDPALHDPEVEREQKERARQEEERKEMEHAKGCTIVATAIETGGKAEEPAERISGVEVPEPANVLAGPEIKSDDNQAAENIKEMDTAIQDVDGPRDAQGDACATVPADDHGGPPAEGALERAARAIDLRQALKLWFSEDGLPVEEEEDKWARVSESDGAAETVRAGQEGRGWIWRLLGW